MCLHVSLVCIPFLVSLKFQITAILYHPPRLRGEDASTTYHDFTGITTEKTKPRLHHIHPTGFGHVCSIVPPMSGNPAFCFTPCVQLSAPFRVNRWRQSPRDTIISLGDRWRLWFVHWCVSPSITTCVLTKSPCDSLNQFWLILDNSAPWPQSGQDNNWPRYGRASGVRFVVNEVPIYEWLTYLARCHATSTPGADAYRISAGGRACVCVCKRYRR